jgi:broad specificity phosphatase PhoE
MRVYLVRHGQTAWNAGHKAQGHTDIPLDEEGLEQARLLAHAFDERPFTRILSSDLRRAKDTAVPLAERHGIQVEERPELRERSFGDWEGNPYESIAQRFIEQEMFSNEARENIRPPNGESQQDVWNRIDRIAAEIETSHEPLVVVSHGGSSALLLARLLRGTLFTARSFRFDNTGITTVARRPDSGFHLIQYNDSQHLRRPALTGSVEGTIR